MNTQEVKEILKCLVALSETIENTYVAYSKLHKVFYTLEELEKEQIKLGQDTNTLEIYEFSDEAQNFTKVV